MLDAPIRHWLWTNLNRRGKVIQHEAVQLGAADQTRLELILQRKLPVPSEPSGDALRHPTQNIALAQASVRTRRRAILAMHATRLDEITKPLKRRDGIEKCGSAGQGCDSAEPACDLAEHECDSAEHALERVEPAREAAPVTGAQR